MMPELSPGPELDDPWGSTDEAPILGLKSALALGVGALAILFSLAS